MPAPEFVSSETAMRVILFGPRAFNEMTKADKMRACFFHCVLRWMTRDYMSNASLRERFSLADKEYQAVSAIIAESIKAGRIAGGSCAGTAERAVRSLLGSMIDQLEL